MASIPKKIAERFVSGIKRFQPILASAKSRDVNESDTAIIVTDMLSEIFGFEKYSEITSEHAIRGTACDLAIKIDGKVHLLIEVKAIGLDLKDAHVKQAIDYAANQGTEWAILTNGVHWRIYNVIFNKPIGQELVAEFNFSALSPKDEEQLTLLHLLSKDGWGKSALSEFHTQRQALSRFSIAALMVSEPILTALRRELRRISPDVRVDVDQISAVVSNEVLKRDVLEGEKADEARRKVSRALNRANRPSGEAAPVPSPLIQAEKSQTAEVGI